MNANIEELSASQEDIDGVTRAALDYIEGFLEANAERHANAYHPEAVKRRFSVDEGTGVEELRFYSPQTMADHAAATTPRDDCATAVVIDAISDDIASVRVYSCLWVDFLHLAKARGEWKLLHVTWHDKATT